MILSNNTFKIINFLIRNLELYNINQIARALDLSVGSVHKILKTLEKRNIVNIRELGNAIYYSINLNNNEAVKLSELVSIEGKNNILRENKTANVYAQDLAKFNAKLIILFGSILTKKNEAKDIDVLFIIKNKEQVNEINNFCLEISKIRTKKVNPLIMLEQDFVNNLKDKNKAIQDLIKNGIILKGEEIFIRTIKNAH
ncbi:MAG: winged helix-turn-helix domain-containing protein [Nanoarchaeota archaeon]